MTKLGLPDYCSLLGSLYLIKFPYFVVFCMEGGGCVFRSFRIFTFMPRITFLPI